MTPKQEDVLYREFKATRYYNTGEFTAFRLAIRAAVAQERERCAKVCEGRKWEGIMTSFQEDENDLIDELAAAIRRGE